MELRDRIWIVMRIKGIPTYYALGKITNIPISTLRDFLNGKTENITFGNVEIIAKTLNMSISELIGEKEERYTGKVKELADISSQLDSKHVDLLLLNAKTLLETYADSDSKKNNQSAKIV